MNNNIELYDNCNDYFGSGISSGNSIFSPYRFGDGEIPSITIGNSSWLCNTQPFDFEYENGYAGYDYHDYYFEDDFYEESYVVKNFIVYENVTNYETDSAEKVLLMDKEDFDEYCEKEFAVIDNSYVLIDDRMCRKSMKENWNIDRESNSFDAIRVALKSMRLDLELSKTLTTEQKEKSSVVEVLCQFFSVEDCYAIRIYQGKIVIYGSYGEKETTDLDGFCEYIRHFVTGDLDKEIEEISDVESFPENYPQVDFVDYAKYKTNIDLSSKVAFFPYEMHIPWDLREYEVTVDLSKKGRSLILEYFSTNYVPEENNSYSREQYEKALLSDENLALNAILSNWHSFFSLKKARYIKSLSVLYQRVVASVYDLNQDLGQTFRFLDRMKFRIYTLGPLSGKVSDLLALVSGYSLNNARCTYSYPCLYAKIGNHQMRIHCVPIEPLGKMKGEIYIDYLSRRYFNGYTDRDPLASVIGKVRSEDSQKEGIGNLDNDFNRPAIVYESNPKQLSLIVSDNQLQDGDQIMGEGVQLEPVAVERTVVVRYQDYRIYSSTFDYLSAVRDIVNRSSAGAFSYRFSREKDDVKGDSYIARFGSEEINLVVRVLEAPDREEARRICARAIYYEVFHHL